MVDELRYYGAEVQAARGLDQQHVAWAKVGAQYLDSLFLRIEVANGAPARRPGRRCDLHAARPDREQRIDHAGGVLADGAMPVRLRRAQLQHVAEQGVAV